MKRDLDRLCNGEHDVLVVGGGVYGAAVAREAAAKGLAVALIERADFGSNTSANSRKTIHGGLASLRPFDLVRARRSIRERSELLHAAPHLVRPLPFLVPTGSEGVAGKSLWRFGLAAADLIGFDRNAALSDPALTLPRSRILSRSEARAMAPQFAGLRLSGAASWYDAQVYDSERLTLAYLRSAVDDGAVVANYVEASRLLARGSRVRGAEVVDQLTGAGFELRSRVVVNCAGPDAPRLRSASGRAPSFKARSFLKAMNVVTRSITDTVAIGVPSGGRLGAPAGLLFLVPWRGATIVGTAYAEHRVGDDPYAVDEDMVTTLLVATNTACPSADLTRADVRAVHVGLLPAGPDGRALATRSELIDEGRAGGLEGVVSMLGVKYTTARASAVDVVRMVCRNLGRAPDDKRAIDRRLHGGAVASVGGLLADVSASRPAGVSSNGVEHVARSYGSEHGRVFRLAERESALAGHLDGSDLVLRAQVAYAVREEMAMMLTDVVFARTGLGSAGHPGARALADAAQIVATERGWDAAESERQLEAVREVYRADGVEPDGDP